MSQPHSELGPELRLLAQAILERLDPALRAAAAMAGEALRGPGRCQQVWCPVCALAALVNGEQHPLLNLIAEHSVTLLAVIRSMTEDVQAGPGTGQTATAESAGSGAAEPDDPTTQAETRAATPDAPPSSNGRYHRIPIVIEAPEDSGA